MFKDVSTNGLEAKAQLNVSSSSLFDDVYNSVSSSLRSLKETIVENPYTSATVGLAATAGLLYLTRGKLWGAAAETEGAFLKLSSHGSDARASLSGLSHSPRDPQLLAQIRNAAKGDLPGKVADTLPPPFDLSRVRTVGVSVSRVETAADPAMLARIMEAARGDIGIRRFAMDAGGKPLTPPFRKDLLTDALRDGVKKGANSAGVGAEMAVLSRFRI